MVKEGRWHFDVKQGREEILNRRIGRNELPTMQAALAYVGCAARVLPAQSAEDQVAEYAQKFVSSPGKRDGLYLPRKRANRRARWGRCSMQPPADGYSKGEAAKPPPYHGYHYRILKAQGPDAPGGAYDYVAQGRMIGGHALVAWPAAYGNSGVMTFLVNHDGVVYEKDLGPNAAAVQKITKFNPDSTWKRSTRR